MEIFLLSFVSLIFFGCSSSAQSDIKTTSKGNNATFLLPEIDNFILAFSPVEFRHQTLSYTLSARGNTIHEGFLSRPYFKTLWKPFLIISKKVVTEFIWRDFPIPVKDQTLKGRELTVSTSSVVHWQQIRLPLENEDTDKIVQGVAKNLTLPEKDGVWIAIRNTHAYVINIDYRMIFGKDDMTEIYQGRIKEGWSIIAVSSDGIRLGKQHDELKNTEVKGRQLWLATDASVDVQVLSMPSPLKDTNIPASTTVNEADGDPSTISTTTRNVIIIITLVIGLLIILIASYFCYRCYLKKKNQVPRGNSEPTGSAAINPNFKDGNNEVVEDSRTIRHSDLERRDSCHDSENSLYGAVIQR